jgi:hypothetical protein
MFHPPHWVGFDADADGVTPKSTLYRCAHAYQSLCTARALFARTRYARLKRELEKTPPDIRSEGYKAIAAQAQVARAAMYTSIYHLAAAQVSMLDLVRGSFEISVNDKDTGLDDYNLGELARLLDRDEQTSDR